MSPSLKLYDMLGGKAQGNTLLRRHQYEYSSLDIDKHLIENKIRNQRATLNSIRKKNDVQKEAIRKLDEYLLSLKGCNGNLSELLGYEGNAAKIYFKALFLDTEWSRRQPRIKPDYINATLDIGYTILFNIIDSILNIYGFDTYCGVMHRQFYMRKSLVCDLVEPFRCLIDRQIIKAIHLGQIKKEDFCTDNLRYYLDWNRNSYYVRLLTDPIIKEKENIFLYIQSYYRAFMKQKPVTEYPVYDITGAAT